MAGIIAVGGFLALAQSALAVPIEERFVSDATTTIISAASVTVPVVPVTDVTSHGPYTGPPPTTTGALSTSVLAASIPALPAESSKYDYPADVRITCLSAVACDQAVDHSFPHEWSHFTIGNQNLVFKLTDHLGLPAR